LRLHPHLKYQPILWRILMLYLLFHSNLKTFFFLFVTGLFILSGSVLYAYT
jgi:hypothetical protein